MELAKLASVELTYTALEALDYASGGQLYGTMEGTLAGDRLGGTLRLTNLAQRRPDNVNVVNSSCWSNECLQREERGVLESVLAGKGLQ